MSQEITKRGKGRPPGSPNKNNIRMRDRFEAAGFDYVKEVMRALGEMNDAVPKLDALVKLAPYFMQRLREESEDAETPSRVTNNVQINNHGKSTGQLMTELLAAALNKKTDSQPT
jgi:hypothetical protein